MRSAKRTHIASEVVGGGTIFQEWARIPSRTSQVRLRSSSTSKIRTLCAAWCQPLECLRVDDAVAVAIEGRAIGIGRLVEYAAARLRRERRGRRQSLPLLDL